MFIRRAEIDSAIAAYCASRHPVSSADALGEASEALAADSFTPSGDALRLNTLRDQITAEPYYREALVNELKGRVADGAYCVPSDQIAEKMLASLILRIGYSFCGTKNELDLSS